MTDVDVQENLTLKNSVNHRAKLPSSTFQLQSLGPRGGRETNKTQEPQLWWGGCQNLAPEPEQCADSPVPLGSGDSTGTRKLGNQSGGKAAWPEWGPERQRLAECPQGRSKDSPS